MQSPACDASDDGNVLNNQQLTNLASFVLVLGARGEPRNYYKSMKSVDRNWQAVTVCSLALLGVFGAARWLHQNYVVRIVRVDDGAALWTSIGPESVAVPSAAAVNAVKPPPIVVRLACVDAGAALRAVKSPSRSLREQLRRRAAKSVAPIPAKRCRPDSPMLDYQTAGESTAAGAVAAR